MTTPARQADALFLAAHALQEAGRHREAAEQYRAALALAPDHAPAHNNLGAALLAQDAIADAIPCFAKALAIRPDFVDAWNNLGTAFARAGRTGEAIVAFGRTLALDPGHFNALPVSLFLKQQLCHGWADVEPAVRRLQGVIESGRAGGAIPLPLLALPGLTRAHHRTAAERFAAASCAAAMARPELVSRTPVRAPDGRRLRIGYLSRDFRIHPVCQLVVDLLERHDRGRFEIVAYAYGPDDGSVMRARVARACDRFHDVQPEPDEDAARRIAGDAIDILVDLTGFTTDGRPGILARRPAPIQVNWLGYPGTLGHPRLADYLIGDPIVTPLEHGADYSETLALLPDCYQPNGPIAAGAPGPGAVTRRDEGLPDEACVFCNFNQTFKITPDVFDRWCTLLREVPGSVLWLLHPPGEVAVRNLRQEAAARGIDAGRLVFAPRRPIEAHLARLPLADLALDTFPYGSHTTGSDLIRAGVPLITRIGDTFASRVAASLLGAAGLPELVADTWDRYMDLARGLGRDAYRCRALRETLAARRRSSPLFDTDRCARNLERLYVRMWDDRGAGRQAPIVLEPAG